MAGGLAVVLLVGGWIGYWHLAARTIEDKAAAWLDERRADGWQAQHEGLTVTGFPFRFVVDVASPVLGEAKRWRWQGPPRVQASALPITPWRWHVSAPGDHHAMVDARTWRIEAPVSFAALEADLVVDGGRLDTLEGRGREAVVRLDGGREVTVAAFEGTLEQIRDSNQVPPPVIEATGELTEMRLPPGTLAPMEDDVSSAKLAATLRGKFDFEGELADSLAAWREAGGVIEIRQLSGRVEPVGADAEGTVTVDADLQPIGAFTVVARGAGEAIDRFERAGMLDQGMAIAAKMAVGAMGGGRGEIRTSLTVQDRTLHVGKLAVTRLPEVTW